MDGLDLSSIVGAALGAGAVQLVTGLRLKSWALATHAWLERLGRHAQYPEPPPHPSAKEHLP